MRRLDLGPEFDGWQVVDPTPQERSGGQVAFNLVLSCIWISILLKEHYVA